MDGILALGHFCELHGPCVILCTQKCSAPPAEQGPHTLTVPWCEACQSVNLNQALVSNDDKCCYVTTRTPLQQDIAFLLKQATVRSLSCEEETSGEGAPLYFGDHERGHVLSHTFLLQDSLARGFYRKYTILMLMRDKIHLLNAWPFLVKHIKEIVQQLKASAAEINGVEQEHCSQRAVRQAQGSPVSVARSLSQLTGKPAIFAHIHMWFAWLLSSSLAQEKSIMFQQQNSIKPSPLLRSLFQDMNREVFTIATYCILTGSNLITTDNDVLNTLRSLLPQNWISKCDVDCTLFKMNVWEINWNGKLPAKLPSLLSSIIKALDDKNLPNSVIEIQITSLITRWYNVTRSLCWTPTIDVGLLQSLGIQKNDFPLLLFWCSSFCDDFSKRQIVKEQLQRQLGATKI